MLDNRVVSHSFNRHPNHLFCARLLHQELKLQIWIKMVSGVKEILDSHERDNPMKKEYRSEGKKRRWQDAQGCSMKPRGCQVLWKQDVNYQDSGLAGGLALPQLGVSSLCTFSLSSARMTAVGQPTTDGLPCSWLSLCGVARSQCHIAATATLGGS